MSWWERQWYKMLGGAVTVAGALRGATVTVDNLTAGRIPIVGTAGLLGDDADLTFAIDTLSAAKIKATGLNPGDVVWATTAGEFTTIGAAATAFSPTFAAGGSMTFTDGAGGAATTLRATYKKFGKMVWVTIAASGTTGGTADNDITITDLPVSATSGYHVLTCLVNDPSPSSAGIAYFSSTSVISVRRYDGGDWSLGAGRSFIITGMYEGA